MNKTGKYQHMWYIWATFMYNSKNHIESVLKTVPVVCSIPLHRIFHCFSLTYLLILSLGIVAKPPPCSADTPPNSQTILLIKWLENSRENIVLLQSAIDAHMSSYAIKVDIVPHLHIPDTFHSQTAIGQGDFHRHRARAIAWIDPKSAKFYVIVPTDNSKSNEVRTLVERDLTGPQDSWSMAMDGLATVVHSALAPLLPDPDTSRQDASTTTQPFVVIDEESPFKSRTPSLPPPSQKREIDWVLQAGYGVNIFNSRGDLQHGAKLDLRIHFATYFHSGLAIDLLFPFSARANSTTNKELRLTRFPLRALVGMHYSHKMFEWGGDLGMVIDFLDVEGEEYLEPSTDGDGSESLKQTNLGFTGGTYWRIHVLPWLALFTHVTIDLYTKSFNYKSNNEISISYGGVHWGFGGGAAFYIKM